MYRLIFLFLPIFLFSQISQSLKQRLDTAFQEFSRHSDLQAASVSFLVEDEQGKVIFSKDANLGLSSASTMKVITVAAFLDSLGGDFRYQTPIYLEGETLVIQGTGDPTLGSWRYPDNTPETFFEEILSALRLHKVKYLDKIILEDRFSNDLQVHPGGWTWNDMGNYYGAGHFALNWRENQYDLKLQGGSTPNEPAKLIDQKNLSGRYDIRNNLISGEFGSGDQSLIFASPFQRLIHLNGKVPAGKMTRISGAHPDPASQLGTELLDYLQKSGIVVNGLHSQPISNRLSSARLILTHFSPPSRDWSAQLLKHSINLYAEAMVHQLGGIQNLKNYWIRRGVPASGLNILDGSGLSPQNYTSTYAQVRILQYARKKKWFGDFNLPSYNGISMKSGTIHAVKGYAGYVFLPRGRTRTFSILINNHQSKNINALLFPLLDVLKVD